MSENNNTQSVSNHLPPYAPRFPMNGTPHGNFNSQNFAAGGPAALNNMANLRASLPAAGAAELSHGSRLNQNYNVVVLPSGHVVPVSNFLPTAQEQNDQFNYAPNQAFPHYATHPATNGGNTANLNWQHGPIGGIAGFEHIRRSLWSPNDENIAISPVGTGISTEPFSPFPYQNLMGGQSYVAGPCQPMKTKDNKGYEVVNLDELTSQDPAIPRAVPALWTNQEEMSLAKCLQNPEGITNVYIRGFMPDTTDGDLHRWASRFGEIESCKAIVEQDTGKCKGFGFVMYYSPAAAENCIRGFFHLGFQASYAQKSRNARLKDLEDRSSTNIYCTGVPIDWNEANLAKHFIPYHAVSTKICRDVPSGVSKEVGFARFESREIAERVVRDFHSVLTEHDGIKLFLRFADTKAQKQLKLQSQERRSWRSREYSYSVEHTPSPTLTRFRNASNGISPNGSYQSAAGVSHNFTPDTSVSPPDMPGSKNVHGMVANRSVAWPIQGGLQTITNSSVPRSTLSVPTQVSGNAPLSVKIEPCLPTKKPGHRTPSPDDVRVKLEPDAAGKENIIGSPAHKAV